MIQNLFGVSALLSYGKLIKYLQIAPHVSWVTRSFTQARQQLLGQLIGLGAIFLGFSMGLHFALGFSLNEFSTMRHSLNQAITPPLMQSSHSHSCSRHAITTCS